MTIKFEDYKLHYKIVSFAKDIIVKNELIDEGLSVAYLDEEAGVIIMLPEGIVLSSKASDIETIHEYNNYDVFEIWENGVFVRKYNDKSDDNYFFITGECNSNCVICPSSEYSRKNSNIADLWSIMELARHIPSDVSHLTITGGEPFLMGEQIFLFIQYLKEKFNKTEFLFLTNGRIFAIKKYVKKFCEAAPYNSIIAIPIHGSCGKIHDAISRANGSFKQTLIGIKKLLKSGVFIEIRIVVNKMNINDFDNIAKLIIRELKGVGYVSIIAMEMTGTARKNCDKVWIPYRESFAYIKEPIKRLIENGIDVKLYNFPLCTVERPFWTICANSISDNKIRYTDVCALCKYKNICGGVFSGTLQLEKDELREIL